jgi:hypothetical protein
MKFFVLELTKEIKLKHWGPGEWVDEPDSFEFEHEGFLCYGIRNAMWDGFKGDYLSLGCWCAYIRIPEGHPWFNVDIWGDSGPDVDVHGGLTFGEMFDNEFWIGFDCGHSRDVIPSVVEMKKKMRQDMKEKHPNLNVDWENSPVFLESYKNMNFVMQEVKSLAEQAKKVNDENK